MTDDQPMLTLNDGRRMPQLGFGTYKIAQDAAQAAVRTALEVGYRLVDTAAIYANERGVGAGLEGRDDVWLTTKIWNDDQGHAAAKRALGDCLDRLGRARVDLLLIHWPCPDKHRFLDTWKAFIELREEGRARSIGVSNFRAQELELIVGETGVVPALNQVECHPTFQQRELRALHEELGICTQSWSPLGRARYFDDPVLSSIASETGQPAAAVVLRWHLQHKLSAIPKASGRAHMADNFAATRLALSEEQMVRIDAMDLGEDGRMGPDPADFC
ncbi:aldo/keto reductase [Sphingomicrobium astaxanthinifaciens]|uniref:aldo/keto reductase n=1 Tax=Sphingomicrobium astaxanthinifaciens TaxID=1227949 RepID=UPI001FCC331D|nr:aldo/keto reductase [Sphingomicrobium astaxanthinifaciens]MCJ7420820.1 aldo/keto reductase [Sphingomicrobium astaxanthinifaciens]